MVAPGLRRGPRPLLLHLMLPGSSAGSPSSSGGLPGWSGPDSALIRAIAAYRRHPWQRDLADPPVIWTEGGSRLLDYGGEGPVVLVVPSLVNKAYVLDLMTGRSTLRWLAREGVRPLLLDWGWPGEGERGFSLTDYCARLERALATVPGRAGLIGYCMGGLLALAVALRCPTQVAALALLATPWDFHADDAETARRLGAMLPWFEPMMLTGSLPVDALQTLFAMAAPGEVADRYRAFGALDPASEAAAGFVALEDWLNDGLPLVAPVAREVLDGWYGRNAPAGGTWRVAGWPVAPAELAVPAFFAIPSRDRIVPAASALALQALLPGSAVHRTAAGHIGMVAGRRAEAALWRPLVDWLRGDARLM